MDERTPRESGSESRTPQESENRGVMRRDTGVGHPTPRDPWVSPHLEVMRGLIRDFNRMFEGWPYLAAMSHPLSMAGAWPKVEAFEREGALVVRAELPGLEREDVKVRVQEDHLIIEGERRRDEESKKREGYYESEWSYGHFSRTVPLPSGADPDQVRATFRNGILEVTIGLTRSATREIPIEGEGGGSSERRSENPSPTESSRMETSGSRERGGTSS
jgi:HSP20 family protein